MDTIDVSKINGLPRDEQIEKRMEIIKSTPLESIPLSILPDSFYVDYYFISYSHKDYQEVYADIFGFQKTNLNVWYDRGIPAGRNWKEEAIRHLTPSTCKGIIFYVSESSLSSDAVLAEIEVARKSNKPFITIHLPFKDSFIYKGKDIKGKVFSVEEMIEIINLKNENTIDSNKAKIIKSVFTKDKIFIQYNIDVESKKEKIVSNTPFKPLLIGKLSDDKYSIGTVVEIHAINDNSAIEITEKDFDDLNTCLNTPDTLPIVYDFKEACLANCINLESVKLPPNQKVRIISEYAFSGCRSLKNIKFDFIDDVYSSIKNHAFSGCSSLIEVNLPNSIRTLSRHAFSGCANLEAINIDWTGQCFSFDGILYGKKNDSTYLLMCPRGRKKPVNFAKDTKTIGYFSFEDCNNIKTIDIPNTVNEIEFDAFSNCKSLEKIAIPNKVTKIGDRVFSNCSALKTVTLGNGLSSVSNNAFSGCSSLEIVKFGKNISEIGDYSFYDCASLEEIKIEKPLNRLGKHAFSGCNVLKNVSLKEVEIIDDFVFYQSPAIESITLSKGLKKLGMISLNKMKKITYKGTKKEWAEIMENSSKDAVAKECKIICADGEYN